MTLKIRIISLIISFSTLSSIYFYFNGFNLPEYSSGVLIFTSLAMLCFNALILEHFFTKPTDVLASAISIILSLSTLSEELYVLGFWYKFLIWYAVILVIASLVSMFLFNPNKPEGSFENTISKTLKEMCIMFGNSKMQFFILFIFISIFYMDTRTPYFILLLLFGLFWTMDPWKLIKSVKIGKTSTGLDSIGKIFSIDSGNVFNIKLFDSIKDLAKNDFVFLKYGNQAKDKRFGIVTDIFFLEDQRWARVLSDINIENKYEDILTSGHYEQGFCYKLPSNKNIENYLKKYIGFITENSNISNIKFIYNSSNDITEGGLLEIVCGEKKVLYQVVQGVTKVEELEAKNRAGYTIGEAVQLGVWNSKNCQFEKFGWVPLINAPVFIAENIEEVKLSANEILLGYIPNSNYPVILNKETSLTHHTAIFGVTGTGKSIFARNLIRNHIKSEKTKVICVDFTGEYQDKFSDLNPINTVSDSTSKKCYALLDEIEAILNKPYAKENDETNNKRKEIAKLIHDDLEQFFKNDENKISIFELPEVSNTTAVLEYTKIFFKVLFYLAKKDKINSNNICLVLEEAHTVIPEWNFAGISDKASQPLLNSISQIALQGRKYGVGLMVIAQRTANVSKTILTQCNTVISFREFDKTSEDFLSNYFGGNISKALQNLKFRQAAIAGKGLKSNVPMIFEVSEIKES